MLKQNCCVATDFLTITSITHNNNIYVWMFIIILLLFVSLSSVKFMIKFALLDVSAQLSIMFMCSLILIWPNTQWILEYTTIPSCIVVSRVLRFPLEKKKVWFYIALYPVRWTAQSALHSPPLADLFIPTPFSASLGSILAMQQLRNDYSLTFPPLSIALAQINQVELWLFLSHSL